MSSCPVWCTVKGRAPNHVHRSKCSVIYPDHRVTGSAVQSRLRKPPGLQYTFIELQVEDVEQRKILPVDLSLAQAARLRVQLGVLLAQAEIG
jgi:hypothetical protein